MEEAIAEGGRALCVAWALNEVDDGCLVGEKVACAELGRSGIRRDAAALFCSAILSFNVDRDATAAAELLPTDLLSALVELAWDEAIEAVGLFESVSRRPLDFASRVSMILRSISLSIYRIAGP